MTLSKFPFFSSARRTIEWAGLNGEGAVKQMLWIKEIVRGFFCHSRRKLRDIPRRQRWWWERRGVARVAGGHSAAVNALHSSIMHSACPSATPFPVTSAACLITRLHVGGSFFLKGTRTRARTHSVTQTNAGHGGSGEAAEKASGAAARQTDYSYQVNKTSVKKRKEKKEQTAGVSEETRTSRSGAAGWCQPVG